MDEKNTQPNIPEAVPVAPVVPTPQPALPSQVGPAAPAQPGGQRDDRFRRGRQGGFGGRGGRPGGPGGRGRFGRPQEKPEYDSKTLDIARVARVTKGGKRFSFRATVAIGNGKGRVGVGVAKGKDVAGSIQKATHQAKKTLITVFIENGTIPYQVEAKFRSAVVIIKPSKSGIKAGGPVRVLAQLAGITSLTGKLVERSNNKLNIARATMEAFKKLKPRVTAASK